MVAQNKNIIRRTVNAKILAQLSGLPPLLQRIYAARGVKKMEDIELSLKGLLHFQGLANIEHAAKRIGDAVINDQRILIAGDFDTDGATSTAVAMLALRAMGALNADYIIPNRFEFGYGLSPKLVDVAITRKPDLIITVDNGISSFAGVTRANEYCVDVIVTDHHLQGETLPDAYAIVNPNARCDTFASKALAGVGVIFYVMLATKAYLSEQGYFDQRQIAPPNLANYLDLVALGTVADVVPLDRNNRILVEQGLRRMRSKQARAGILALCEVAGRAEASRLVASDMGFAVGPRLNAAGRLDDMSLGVQCLLADDWDEAYQYAQQLDALNQERRQIENDMKQQAFQIVDSLQLDQKLPLGLCLYDKIWHQGVVGLVASRIKDQLHRPTIAFAQSEAGWIKGSARSIEGVPIRDVLENIAAKNPDVLSQYGGHAMAAGLSIREAHYAQFSEYFHEGVSQYIAEKDCMHTIESDGALLAHEITLENARLLEKSGPWGQQFPEPLFDGVFEVLSQRLVGGQHLKLTLKHPEKHHPINAIAFYVDMLQWPNARAQSVYLVYRLSQNHYQDRLTLQLMVEFLSIHSTY